MNKFQIVYAFCSLYAFIICVCLPIFYVIFRKRLNYVWVGQKWFLSAMIIMAVSNVVNVVGMLIK